MKIGILTASLPMDTKDALQKARELGAHGAQLRVVDNDLDPRNLTRTGRADLITFMASLGLERSALCGDLGGGFADPATVDERVSRTKDMIDLCLDLITPILTTCIGAVPADTGSSAYSTLLESVREIAGYAAERECAVAVETGSEPGETLGRFLKVVDSPVAMVNYDPASLCMKGFDPLNDVYVLRNFIVHTHARDAVVSSGGEGGGHEARLGDGDVNFPDYLAALRDIGYDGYLTIKRETGADTVADIIEAIQFLKQQEGVES